LQTSPFDDSAAAYDVEFTDTAVARQLREIVWARFDTLLRPGHYVLDLGCGTGEDAVHLAERGVRLVATDASERMTHVARQKALARGCADRVEVRQLAVEEVASALAGRRFDGLISNFGALNCVRDLSALAASMAGVVNAGAPLIWVIMGRYVPWEWAWYLAHGQGAKALRRLRRDGTQWRGLTISYPTPREVSAALRPFFRIERLSPLGVVLPPSYAAAWLNRSPRALKLLTRLELLTQGSGLFAACADHYIVEARRL
jgi:2-polyprenyl-3-methyl-5-hydroxy-6-metoxy-1,4-benzoquinol methylase